MSVTTLRELTIGTVLFGLVAGCGPGDSSVLLTLSNLPARATLLAVRATLDQRPLTGTSASAMPLMLPLDQNQLGLTLPGPGHLALDIQALDSDQCTQGKASPELDVTGGLSALDAPLAAQSPRKCGSLAPCATGVGCTSPSSGTTSPLRSIWTIAANDIWAVGAAATVLHFNGTSWTATPPASLPVPATTQWNGVWASASNDVWVVGSAGRVIHYDGSKWTASPTGAVRDLKSISGVSGQSIWAVGLSSGGTTLGEFWHWNGTAWTAITPLAKGDLNAVLAVNPNFIVVAGGDSGFSGVLWVLDGSGTFKNYSTAAPVTLNGLWAASASRVIAVGAVSEILSFDGVKWTLAQNAVNDDYNAVTSDGKYTYFVGASGVVGRASDPALKTVTPITGLPFSTFFSIQLASNGLAWFTADKGFIGFLDTRP